MVPPGDRCEGRASRVLGGSRHGHRGKAPPASGRRPDHPIARMLHREFLGHWGPRGKGLLPESIISGPRLGPTRACRDARTSEPADAPTHRLFPLTHDAPSTMFGRHQGWPGTGVATTGRTARGRVTAGSPITRLVAASESYRDMFCRLSRLVTRRPIALVVAWHRAGRRAETRRRRAGIRSPRTTTSGSSRRISPA